MRRITLGEIRNLFTGMSLVKKFIFAYLFIIAIPTVVFGVYSFRNIKSGTIGDAQKSDMYKVQQLRSYINRNLEICNRAAQQAISNRDFLEFLCVRREITAEDYLQFRSGALYRFESIHNINPDIYKIRFFTDNPYLDEVWPSIYKEQWIKSNAWWQRVLENKGNNFWLLNHVEESLHGNKNEKLEEVVSLYRDVAFTDNEHVAVLEVNMAAGLFFGDIYTEAAEEETMLCAISVTDTMIYNRSSTFAMNQKQNLASLQQQLKNNALDREGSFTFELYGHPFTAAYAFIKELNLTVFKVTSIEVLTKKLDKTRNLILLGIIGGMIVLGAVTYLISSVLLVKMKLIIASMRKVQAGNLNVEIPVEGNDEIGELAHHFRIMMDKINELITVVVRKQSAAKDAEIRALQTQINAHFIYNVLEAIKTSAEIDYKYDISDNLTALGRLMRYSMHWTNIYVTLREEISHIKNYLALMNLRCDNKISVSIEIREDLHTLEVLKMTLQPIVENAINHGLAPKNWQGRLDIRAYIVSRNLTIEVMDDGVGMSPKQLSALMEWINSGSGQPGEVLDSGGIGLKNVNERLKLFYGEEYGLKISSVESEYTKVWVILPYRKGLWR